MPRSLRAFARRYLDILGGFTPLTAAEIATRYWPKCAPWLDGPASWAFGVFALGGVLRAAYLAGREVEGEERERARRDETARRATQRRLSTEAKAELMRDHRYGAVSALDLRSEVSIVIERGDAESAVFAEELRVNLLAAGWDARIVAINPRLNAEMIEVQGHSLIDKSAETEPIREALRISGHTNRYRKIEDEGGLPGGGFVNVVIPPLRQSLT